VDELRAVGLRRIDVVRDIDGRLSAAEADALLLQGAPTVCHHHGRGG
jgi:hypothetical protein